MHSAGCKGCIVFLRDGELGPIEPCLCGSGLLVSSRIRNMSTICMMSFIDFIHCCIVGVDRDFNNTGIYAHAALIRCHTRE